MADKAIGLLVPANNTVIEREFHSMAPPGISVFGTRLLWHGPLRPRTLEDEVLSLEEDIPDAVARLAEARPDVLVYGCSAASFVTGMNGDERIASTIRRTRSLPVVTAASAAREALKHLQVTRVALGTPYPEDLTADLIDYLAEWRFRAVAVRSIPYSEAQGEHAAAGLAMDLDGPNVEAIFLCCTDLRTVHVIQRLEEHLHKPVVSSNQAALWAGLRILRFPGPIEGFGTLLSRTPAGPSVADARKTAASPSGTGPHSWNSTVRELECDPAPGRVAHDDLGDRHGDAGA